MQIRSDEQGEARRRKDKKKGMQVPLSQLGFRAKVYYGIQTEYTRKRVKYKAAKYGVENSKQCFMGRLTFIVDPLNFSHQELETVHLFKGIKKGEWEKIKKIIFHSRQQLSCPICLDKKFKAPQMTTCGHVFCWPCIYMHVFKSLRANFCPVCNDVFTLESLVTCQPIFGKSFDEIEQNKIKLSLKCKKEGKNKVYNPVNYQQDMQFAKIIKATTHKIKQIFCKEQAQIMSFLNECDEQEISKYVGKVISLSEEKILKLDQILVSKREYKYLKNQKEQQGMITSILQDKSNLIYFYQQHSGRLIFLHPLCDKFIRQAMQEMPIELDQQILYWQQVQYNMDLMRRFKIINHLTLNQEIDMVIIDMSTILPTQINQQFQLEFQQFKCKKQEETTRQEKESERIQQKYDKEKQYMKKLKKLEESQFFDIHVPTTIDPSQLDDATYFPSLIQTKSTPEYPSSQTSTEIEHHKNQQKKEERKAQRKAQSKGLCINHNDFPGLLTSTFKKQQTFEEETRAQISLPVKIFQIKSQTPKQKILEESEFPDLSNSKAEEEMKLSKKGRRKKQKKFINVTEQFFGRNEDDN